MLNRHRFYFFMETYTTSRGRENILRNIRKGLHAYRAPMPFPEADKTNLQDALAYTNASVDELFATEFIQLGGKFIYCANEAEMHSNIIQLIDQQNWKQVLSSDATTLNHVNQLSPQAITTMTPENSTADACITLCDCAVARTGSFLFSSKQMMGRTAPVFYPAHIVVLYSDQIVLDIQHAIDYVKEHNPDGLPSMINLNTGPSRTADIEKTLVVGVHGPKEVYCLFVQR